MSIMNRFPSGGGGGMQYAKGSVTKSKVDTEVLPYHFISVRGLAFKPRAIFIGYKSSSNYYTPSCAFFNAAGTRTGSAVQSSGNSNCYAYNAVGEEVNTQNNAKVYDDGFDMCPTTSTSASSSTWYWVAIG